MAKTHYFWAKAERHIVGNFRPEVRATNGMITQPEASLRFENGVFATEDEEKIACIRESMAFGKDCYEVPTMEEARKQHLAARARNSAIVTEATSFEDVKRITTQQEAQMEASTGGNV